MRGSPLTRLLQLEHKLLEAFWSTVWNDNFSFHKRQVSLIYQLHEASICVALDVRMPLPGTPVWLL